MKGRTRTRTKLLDVEYSSYTESTKIVNLFNPWKNVQYINVLDMSGRRRVFLPDMITQFSDLVCSYIPL